MARRLEPTYPSFSLVLNEAFEPFQLPPYDSHSEGNNLYSTGPQFNDPLLTTVDYRFHDAYYVPVSSWDDAWEPNLEARNLQAALGFGGSGRELSTSKRRRFSALVIDLALRIRQKCSIRSLRRQQMTPVVRVSYLDLTS